MVLFRKKADIGKAITERVKDYPVFRKEPKKKPQSWIECHDYILKPPKNITREEEERYYPYFVSIFSDNYIELLSMRDYMIEIGKEDIEFEKVIFWLHAVKHSIQRVRGKRLYKSNLTYIFRIRQSPEEISEEVK